MFKELFSRSHAHEFSGPMSVFSPGVQERQIEIKFVERVVSRAARAVSIGFLDARTREEEALMRAVEAGAFDPQIEHVVSRIGESSLRSFDDAPVFSYEDWASGKRKD